MNKERRKEGEARGREGRGGKKEGRQARRGTGGIELLNLIRRHECLFKHGRAGRDPCLICICSFFSVVFVKDRP